MSPFRRWLDKSPPGTTKRLIQHGVLSSATIHKLRHGGLLRDYSLARRVSEATEGVVSIADLCEQPKTKRRAGR